MGYDVHITRKENWLDDGPAISIEEWKTLVTSDPELRLDGYAEATIENEGTLRIESEGLSVWIGYTKHGEKGNMAWFSFSRGMITVKNPDTEILKKMWLSSDNYRRKYRGMKVKPMIAKAKPFDK